LIVGNFYGQTSGFMPQATTWLNNKHCNIVKYHVAVAPVGVISFVSSAWGGRVTDRSIVPQSGILSLVEPGDVVLTDQGFNIQKDLLL
jgi:hypothetical protein